MAQQAHARDVRRRTRVMGGVSVQEAMTPAALFAEIESVAPSFGSLAKQHIEDNDELLPHLLMANLLRYVGACIAGEGDTPASEAEVRAVLTVLEAAATSGNPETENVVAVSFCEGIESEPFFPKLRPLLGLALRRRIRNQQR